VVAGGGECRKTDSAAAVGSSDLNECARTVGADRRAPRADAKEASTHE
jgi:hypothetical protein